ncbi:MAG: hypothetical protein KF765_06555 [Parvibaculaceae bacterium]|nr:hypothetical protein [Parvibaculaceae bacterium]
MNQLTSRLRPIIKEMALPLKQSTKQMSIGAANDNRKYVHMDPSIVRAIQSRHTEDEVVAVEGHVKSYDRDLGVGKVKSDLYLRSLNFTVPIGDRKRLRNAILTAMTKDKTILHCRQVIDESGLPTSLIVLEVDNSAPDQDA